MEEQNGELPSLLVHRLLENRSTLNELGSGSEGSMTQVKGQGPSELDSRHNWIPRRRNSSNIISGSRATGMTRRCVCNLSQCASTNYMCKSERQVLPDGSEGEGGCFIEGLEPPSGGAGPTASSLQGSTTRPTSARRGCIEMLSREKQDRCRRRREGGLKDGGLKEEGLKEGGLKDGGLKEGALECCFEEDMCNYPKTFYPSALHPTQGPFTNSVSRIPFDPPGGRLGTLDHQVWLRAAVIAVPICGLIILILLIYVAKKLLSSEEYKNVASYTSSRKNHYQQKQGGELLLPSPPPHILDLSAPPPGHCFWCSAPRSTAYPAPDPRGEDPTFCPGALDESLWNQLQEESANHNEAQPPWLRLQEESPNHNGPQPPWHRLQEEPSNQNQALSNNLTQSLPSWQQRLNFLNSKLGLCRAEQATAAHGPDTV